MNCRKDLKGEINSKKSELILTESKTIKKNMSISCEKASIRHYFIKRVEIETIGVRNTEYTPVLGTKNIPIGKRENMTPKTQKN